ncbi:MAG: Glycosyltransferase [uncultured Sulfurovum sp.]|uniref:Glycosyltransferase n=1 Tax=uncultured Sulfurovum sp. TaxID=269237 RepID=A0A6S6TN44_9BACT|nr:MAG: Glycosyltransferase [uncultured Sulfurovum sp.]
MMNKLLLITDQEEYSENGTITTLFDGYLKKYWDVDIVYITPYKHSFQRKGNHLIVPKKYQDKVMEYLSTGNDLCQYDFVIVRNKKNVLENVLKYKETYQYKVGYRISYPKKYHQLELNQSFSPRGIYNWLKYTMKIKKRNKFANLCDLFLPTSDEAQQIFYPDIKVKSFPLFIGLDPEKLREHSQTEGETIHFINIGTMDRLREFDVVLDAFESLSFTNWHLNIVVAEKTFIRRLLALYPKMKEKITLHEGVHTLDELRDITSQNDMGIALLPQNNFHNTVIANKIIRYSSCGLPSLMVNNAKNHSVFSEEEAYFSDFNVNSIRENLEKIMNIPKAELVIKGKNSQEKLLKIRRNYKVLAKELAEEMNKIVAK